MQYSIRSVVRRSEGPGGKMNVPRAWYSLRMSFWVVPPRLAAGTPRPSATAWYISSRIAAVALMVIEVVTRSSGMPSNRRSMSSSESIATPARPASPSASGSVES